MTLDPVRFQKLLGDFKLEQLFNELGWDRASLGPQTVAANAETFTLTAVAQKRGVAVLRCTPDSTGCIPPRATLLKIEKEAVKLAHEHLLVFADVGESMLTWLWVSRAPGQPTTTGTHTWHKGQSGEALRQKLSRILFTLDEEEALTLSAVTVRVRDAFDRDRISKRFYERFKSEHEAFTAFIAGLITAEDQAWYASLMLNRLMFVYFIQRKGFLDGNINYLADRMQRVRIEAGAGHFHSFYRMFLRRLFHEGLGQAKGARGGDLTKLIGDVPYLNGGLFAVHELEEVNPDIDISDEAFERLFRFFDAYDWHLDDRPLSSGSEINPDVLGYIFEKYINAIQPGEQKSKGAYYTKEDITEYISKNTVIPHLIEQARERCKVAFDGEASVWNLLKADPDRYLYPAMKTGVVDAGGNIVPESALPDFVQAGMKDPKARMFERRYNLGEAVFHTATGERGTLPTETWREYAERRNRCLALRDKLAAGEVKTVDDLITFNLDIRQFMQDVIDTCASPDLLRAVWQAIVGRVPERANEKFRHGISILDPTCGSGAFLFAALGVLEPLYEACLDRMEGFVEDAKRAPSPASRESEARGAKSARGEGAFADFTKILAEVAHHPSRRYFIYKSIILHNLFGVDIMAEAVEICKLRLFLKLVSQVDGGRELEPLPDIDFNIRAGNTLVGYATEAQFDAANTLASDQGHRDEIKASTVDLADLFDRFREQQTVHGGKVTADDKRKLRDKLNGLSLELDRYLAHDYGIDPDNATAFDAWRTSHQPFHWFAEFYGVMREGGFDVVIGNPPYIEMHKVNGYQIGAVFKSLDCGNLYAPISERALHICNARKGYLGLIVPLSVFATERMRPIQSLLNMGKELLVLSHFDVYPSKLFEGAKQRLTIIIRSNRDAPKFVTSSYQRWLGNFRDQLFQTLSYWPAHYTPSSGSLEKISGQIHSSVLNKLRSFQPGSIKESRVSPGFYVHRIPYNYVKALNFVPYFWNETDGEKKSEDYKPYAAVVSALNDAAISALNSNLFFMWWHSSFEGYHCGKHEIISFPFGANKLSPATANELKELSRSLMLDLGRNKNRKEASYKKTGKVVYDEFFPRKSKANIDKIDLALQKHFGLTDEETDFTINYDIKYRIGGADEEE